MTAERDDPRRVFLSAGGSAPPGLAVGRRAAPRARGASRPARRGDGHAVALAATDGYIRCPGAPSAAATCSASADPLRRPRSTADHPYKGKMQYPAPILAFTQGDDVNITSPTSGSSRAPTSTDAHTIHWHGFRNAIALFDGVPEMSIAVPPSRHVPYYYQPHDPGTYMYHCHFEDVEHVQMGMTGIVYVRPTHGRPKFAYNDASTASTASSRCC